MHGYRLALKILTLSESKFCFKGQPISSPHPLPPPPSPPPRPPPPFDLAKSGSRPSIETAKREYEKWIRRGVKAIRAASETRRFCRRSNRDKTQEHSAAARRRRRRRTGVGGWEGRKDERKNLRKYTPRSAYDGSTARSPAWLVRNINVNGGNMRPIRSQFHSRPDTPTPRLSPSDQNRVATLPPSPRAPAFDLPSPPSSAPGPANLHPLIGGESAFGNPKLCAAATRGRLIQCLSNWVTRE